MKITDLLRRAVTACESLKLDYFVSGSVASSFYGEYRLTHDIDIVIELPSWKVRELCEQFPAPEFYVDEGAAMAAARSCGQFNILHSGSGFKIDFMVMDDSPFNESRRARAFVAPIAPGVVGRVSKPEDVILMKLVYYHEGGSEKHNRDIASMFKVSGDQIDCQYIEQWASRLGVERHWQDLKKRLNLM